MSATTINAEPSQADACSYRLILGGSLALFASDGRDITPKSRKCRAILAYLATHAGERIRRERLIDLLWGDRFDAQARLSLRQALFEIRRTAGEALVCSDREHVWMDPSLLQMVEDEGEPFSGLTGITPEFDEWVLVERAHRTGEAFSHLNNKAERLIADGRGSEALPLIERMRKIDPLHDAWVRLAMKVDHQAGSASAVHKRFIEFSQALEAGLGVRPASETNALHDWLIADLTKRPEGATEPEATATADVVPAPAIPATPTGIFRKAMLFAGKRRMLFAAVAIVPFIIIAVGAREAALKQRQAAEQMAEFMLGDARDNLQPAGKIDAIEGVAQRVVDYYSDKSDQQLSDPELRQRSRALSLLGQAQSMRGDTASALQLYHQAAAGTAEWVRRNPNDPQRLFDHAQNIFWIGELQRNRGNIDSAEIYYREYKRLADRMNALDPDNLKWRMEVLYANEDVGIVLFRKRHFAEAVTQFQSALVPMQSVISLDGSKPEYQKEFANVLGWLADAERASGHLDKASAIRQQQIATLERSIAAGLDDTDLRERLAPAHEGLGILYSEQGQPEKAIAEHREALAEAQNLIAQEPGNSLWNDVAANVRFELAQNLLTVGKRDEAAQQASLGCKAAADLIHLDPSVVRWRMLENLCFTTGAQFMLQTGSKAAALGFAERALASAKSMKSGDSVQDSYYVASASRLLGDVRRASGDTSGAISAWSAGLSQLPPNATERPWEMKAHADLLSRLGRVADSGAIQNRLNAVGYRRAS
jgi:DNA-binding SARP family transcriptional activator/tetratricopeptide (TPR) repeat protein